MSEKTLFIKIFQPFAQYRNPFTFYYAQTYPLPPKSTIIGMLQNACDDWYGNSYGLEKWWNLKISIHGGFENFFWNYQNLIKGDVIFDDGVLKNQELPLYGEGRKSQRSPVSQQELFNGHLYLFIRGEESLIDKIKVSLQYPQKVLSLGRSEDVVFIREVKEVFGTPINGITGDIKLTYPTYIVKDNFPIEGERYPVYSLTSKVVFKNKECVKHKSEITKDTKRELELKTVIYTGYDYRIILKENCVINAEKYKIEEDGLRDIFIIKESGWI